MKYASKLSGLLDVTYTNITQFYTHVIKRYPEEKTPRQTMTCMIEYSKQDNCLAGITNRELEEAGKEVESARGFA